MIFNSPVADQERKSLVAITGSVNLNKVMSGNVTAPENISCINKIIIDACQNYGFMKLFILRVLVYRSYFINVFT